MSRGEKAFSIIIRCVFILAFGAFLSASIHHVAVFFQNFEPATPDNSVSLGSYALAVSIDGTALILTIGMMFFSKGIAWHAKFIVWFFIICLTGFSWVVNWEYAVTYQTATLTSNLVPAWKNINPILASSFAFLNLAYSVVSEFFGTKEKTAEELKAELDGLTGERAQLMKQIKEAKGPGIIHRAKETALEVKKAAEEVLAKEEEVQSVTTLEVSQPAEVKTEVQSSSDELDKLELTVAFLQQYPAATDEQIADYLGMKRPASARFWRLKAGEIATLNHAQNVEVEVEETTPVVDAQTDLEDGSDEEINEEPDAELFKEIPEEEYQQFYGNENGSEEERITDPEVEAVDVKNRRHSGSLVTSKTSTVSLATRRRPMTVAEVARELLISERQVRGLRAQGKLAKDDQDETLIKTASVRAYKASKKVKVS
jgi:hypothetical protein